jgi:putative nucleotidyltransferase with HDIG domain
VAAGSLAQTAGQADGQPPLATLVALAEALDIRDTGTTRHSHTVALYAELTARRLGFQGEHLERVRLAGVLHDIGKIGLSDALLSKAGPLEVEEWQEMYTHPEIGARLLARPEFDDLRSWIVAHHERPDGAGYPYGLSADDIPLEARILAVADAYEAMTAARVYRPSLGAATARTELEAGAGTQFDATVVSAFLESLDAAPTERLTRVG